MWEYVGLCPLQKSRNAANFYYGVQLLLAGCNYCWLFHTLCVSGLDQYGRVNGRKDGWMDERAKTEFGSNNHLPCYHMLFN